MITVDYPLTYCGVIDNKRQPVFLPQADRRLMLVIVTGKIQEYDRWRGEHRVYMSPKKPFTNEAHDRSRECT